MEEEQRLAERWTQAKERVAWFITDAPLYQIVKVDWKWRSDASEYDILPEIVSMPCDRCAAEVTNWAGGRSAYHKARGLHSVVYTCRNCRESTVTIYYYWLIKGEETHFEKVGRYPKPEITPPRELAKALGKHLTLYRKGMILRHHAFGLGALVYFRRIVEETTGELLDLLEAAIRESGDDEGALTVIGQAKAAQHFDEKVKVAAKALPARLFMGGANPFDVLFQLLSDGMHARTDEESVDIVDGIDKILAHLFTELKAHTEKRKAYAEGLKELLARRETTRRRSR